ncbi:glutathione S-transferase [Sphingomonas guangdongensis]|uniref:Glutathione S-transferase n=1 Tax=Sphingomonas guangdongensis TaxID=1141890 RepID=A0A285R246_9SPHN|nr:glutathione S-transferase [Sphingomonas guangdongensis]
MTDLTLYTNPMSRGRIARWMLEEVGADYETVVVEFGGDPALLPVNPMGKVPAIVHAGTTITECAAICAYLADAFPDAGLAPPVAERAAYYRWLFFAAGPLEQAVVSNSLGWKPEDKQQALVGFGTYDRTIDTLEQAVEGAGDGWLTGERFTAADLYVGAHLGWGTMFGSIPKRDAFVRFVERTAARPAAQRANALDDALMPQASD